MLGVPSKFIHMNAALSELKEAELLIKDETLLIKILSGILDYSLCEEHFKDHIYRGITNLPWKIFDLSSCFPPSEGLEAGLKDTFEGFINIKCIQLFSNYGKLQVMSTHHSIIESNEVGIEKLEKIFMYIHPEYEIEQLFQDKQYSILTKANRVLEKQLVNVFDSVVSKIELRLEETEKSNKL